MMSGLSNQVFRSNGNLPNLSIHPTSIPLGPFDNLRTFSSIEAADLRH